MIFRYAAHQTCLVGPVRLAEVGFGGAMGARPVPLGKRVKRKLRAAAGRHGCHSVLTERGLGVVIYRKSHYGSRSRRGTEVALFYSLIDSAKLSGVEPKRCLVMATRAALADRTAVTRPCDLLAGDGHCVCPPVPRVPD